MTDLTHLIGHSGGLHLGGVHRIGALPQAPLHLLQGIRLRHRASD